MLEAINTLEKARNFDFTKRRSLHERHLGTVNLGSYDYKNRESEQSKNALEVFEYVMSQCGPIRLVPWENIKEHINENRTMGFGQLNHNSYQYNRYLHLGWTEKLRPDHPIGGGSMDFMNVDGEYQKLSSVSDDPDCDELNDEEENSICACYYHSAKAHWLVNSVQKEGLRQPVQGHTHSPTGSEPVDYRLTIHPGSIRSKVLETMDEPHFLTLVTDYVNAYSDIPALSCQEILDYFEGLLKEPNEGTLSAIWVGEGKIEWSLSAVGGTDFRNEVFDFNRRVSKLCKKKPVNIYLGYDSSHGEVYEVAEKSIYNAIEKSKSGGHGAEFFNDYKVEVKKLDIATIPEYNRDYANQSTEFTYSRFLIPYLENYEGFSYFIDDDYIWEHTPMSLFYFLDPEHAVACVQYDFKNHEETKFNGEKNISYPKKLWSSMMIFNNGHEDCKKLTPEVVNTQTGKYLHQFEWTNQISKIPHNKICTEGYDTLKKSHHAVHYTRGGPWIKDMDCSNINMLNYYEKHKMSKLKKKVY